MITAFQTLLIIIFVSCIIYSLRLVALVTISLFRDRYETKELLEEYKKAQYGIVENGVNISSSPFYDIVISKLFPLAKNKSSFLDVGCGLGRVVFEFEKLGIPNCIGIDKSERFIEYCSDIIKQLDYQSPFEFALKSKAKFVCADVMTYDFKDQLFDFITCLNVIDRVRNPYLLIEKLKQLLVTDGILLVTTPYDWKLSQAPSKYHVEDIKELLDLNEWELIQEAKSIPYIVQTSKDTILYYCDLLVVKKRF